MQLRSSVAMAVVQASAAVPIRPLAWELPYATAMAMKIKKKKIWKEEKADQVKGFRISRVGWGRQIEGLYLDGQGRPH